MNTRHQCPECQHNGKTFSLYIDTETGEQVYSNVGRCNREINCGYHYTPKQFFQDNPERLQKTTKAYNIQKVTSGYKKSHSKPASYISENLFKESLKSYTANHFIKFLLKRFGAIQTNELISRYFIGSSKHWYGATVYWQVDTIGKIRTGKIMLYDGTNGKRVKKPFNHITWVHTALKLHEFELNQCFFGEHLLKDLTKPVAIVESEKTAIIASGYLPQFIWIATGSLSNLSFEKCLILKNRAVTLFPDLNGFEAWTKKAKGFSAIGFFQVSDLLERKATEDDRKQGLDLADYLLRYNPIAFQDNLDSNDLENQQIQVGPETIKSENYLSGIPAFIDQNGKLFIETPLGKTFTVYPSVSDYNNRSSYPDFIPIVEIDHNLIVEIEIDLFSLTIK